MDLGNGNVGFQCGNGYNASASARYGDYSGQVQFQAPYSADWITSPAGDETFQGANLAGANLSNAAITDVAGSIPMQCYDQNGKLTPSFPLPYPAGTFSAASSFSAETVCPNGAPYSVNTGNGLSMAQMMAATDPPTSWSPADQETAPSRALAGAGQ